MTEPQPVADEGRAPRGPHFNFQIMLPSRRTLRYGLIQGI